MARDFLHAIDDILETIARIEQASAGKSFEDFKNDWLLRRAIERGVEIISEASRAIPDEAKALQPDVPWRSVHAIGNVLRHQYHSLSDRIIWNVVVDELPRLKVAVTAIRRGMDRR
jgi:uncharacterized protein with HEPN domain